MGWEVGNRVPDFLSLASSRSRLRADATVGPACPILRTGVETFDKEVVVVTLDILQRY